MTVLNSEPKTTSSAALLPPEGWRPALMSALASRLSRDKRVVALAVYGSTNDGGDAWSDLDLLVVVTDEALPSFREDTRWLDPQAEVLAAETFIGERSSVLRIFLADLRRVDVTLTTEAALAEIAQWPSVSFWKGATPLFSRSSVVSERLERTYPPPKPSPITADDWEAWRNRFRFRIAVAVQKMVRGDFLIALHLALEAEQDCCVLGMMLRDRELGTTVHRSGGGGNALATALMEAPNPNPPHGLLDKLERILDWFEELASQWIGALEPTSAPLRTYIQAARATLAEEGAL